MSDDILEHIDSDIELEFIKDDETEIDASLPSVMSETTKKVVSEKQQEIEEDFQKARHLQERTMQSMHRALDVLDTLAPQMEKGSFWEAYANVLKEANSIAKDVLDVHQKRENLSAIETEAENQPDSSINIEKAVVYTGSLSDMQREMIDKNLIDNPIQKQKRELQEQDGE